MSATYSYFPSSEYVIPVIYASWNLHSLIIDVCSISNILKTPDEKPPAKVIPFGLAAMHVHVSSDG